MLWHVTGIINIICLLLSDAMSIFSCLLNVRQTHIVTETTLKLQRAKLQVITHHLLVLLNLIWTFVIKWPLMYSEKLEKEVLNDLATLKRLLSLLCDTDISYVARPQDLTWYIIMKCKAIFTRDTAQLRNRNNNPHNTNTQEYLCGIVNNLV